MGYNMVPVIEIELRTKKMKGIYASQICMYIYMWSCILDKRTLPDSNKFNASEIEYA